MSTSPLGSTIYTNQTNTPKQKKLFNKIYAKFLRMNEKQHIISPNDKILIGYSGGKDSLLLLHILSTFSKNPKFAIEVKAIHIINSCFGHQLDIEHSKQICDCLGVELVVLPSEEFEQKDIEDINDGCTICLKCSKNRRMTLLKYAQDNNYTSVAFGHHMDDVAETLLLNELFCSCTAGIPAQITTKKHGVKIIRPLIDVPVELIEEWGSYRQLPPMNQCSYGKDNRRVEVREILRELKKNHPHVSQCMTKASHNFYEEYL
ncbi:tRNA(Ile)-lysidine/2-thiocytidine synthase N-terminal domain-containing protein [Entamoeba marina]